MMLDVWMRRARRAFDRGVLGKGRPRVGSRRRERLPPAMREKEARATARRVRQEQRRAAATFKPEPLRPAPAAVPQLPIAEQVALAPRAYRQVRRGKARGGSAGYTMGFLLVGAVLVAGVFYGLNWALSADRGFLSLAVGVGAPSLPTPAPAVAATPSPRPTQAATPIPSPTPRVYVVKSGDTLTRIAREHETTVDDLVEANRLDRQAVLSVGQQLVIPLPASRPHG